MPIQTVGGEEDVQQHEPPGQMGAPLQLPQAHLGEEQDEDADAEREEPRRVLASRGEIAEAEQEGEQEDPHDHGVHVDDRLAGVRSRSILSAAPPPECGPAAVASEPLTMRTNPATTNAKPEPAQLQRNERLRAADDRRAHLERQARSQPASSAIDSSRCSITIGQRRSLAIASRPIGACASVPRKIRKRKPRYPARQSRRAANREPGEQRERDRHAADETVAELDECVRVLRRQRMPLFAARPVPAAEPGVGEPHRRAGADDQPERAELGDHERKDLRRSEDDRPEPSERRGLGVHGFESSDGHSGSRIDG